MRRADDIGTVIRAIVPWLVGKREHAALMLRLLEVVPRSLAAGRGASRVRAPENGRLLRCYTAEAFEIVQRLRELNRRFAPGEWSARAMALVQVDAASSSSERPRVSSPRTATTSAVPTIKAVNKPKTPD